MVDPRDERLIHRLEAFSDIVIGFSMAFLAVNLGAADESMARMATHIVAFLSCFAFVAILWWLHNRLFAFYFVATRFCIVANFAALAALALFIYATTTIAHRLLEPDVHVKPLLPYLGLWMGLYGTVLALFALLYAIGIRERWSGLPYPIKHWGVARALNAGLGGIALIVIAFFIASVYGSGFPWIVLVALVSVVAERWLTPRIVGKAPPA